MSIQRFISNHGNVVAVSTMPMVLWMVFLPAHVSGLAKLYLMSNPLVCGLLCWLYARRRKGSRPALAGWLGLNALLWLWTASQTGSVHNALFSCSFGFLAWFAGFSKEARSFFRPPEYYLKTDGEGKIQVDWEGWARDHDMPPGFGGRGRPQPQNHLWKESLLEIDDNTLGRLAEQRGLRDQIPLLKAMRSHACRLIATKEPGPVASGGSKFFGLPDVPPDFPWPIDGGIPCGFLAQISLKDLPDSPARRLLPETGLLSFYYPADLERTPGGSPVVYHFPNPELLVRTEGPRNEGFIPAPIESALTFANLISVPDSDDLEALLVEIPDGQASMIRLWLDQSGHREDLSGPDHQLLGEAFSVNGAVENWSPNQEFGDEQHVLLLQMETDRRLNFQVGDCGTLYYLIPQKSLEAGRFEKTFTVMECA